MILEDAKRFTENLEKYNESRLVLDKTKICQAPFRNMYLNVHGQVASCWLTFHNTERYPQKSLMDIWRGDYYRELRESIDKKQLSKHCQVCARNISNGNFHNPLAKAYDLDEPLIDFPTIMEFEMSNKCNLECVMCNGNLSSSIRKNRDHLEPLPSPYDQNFLKQLEEFIPHLKEARFNGGEPFLHSMCYDIWEKIVELNPNVEITIATNGSQYNSRIEALLQRGKFRINISVDGMSKDTYEKIRVNADFDRLIGNIHKFGKYCETKKTILSIMINPMRNNWQEMPDFINFCNKHNYHLWFNTIYRPFHLSLWNLPSTELKEIYETLSDKRFIQEAETKDNIFYGNTRKYEKFVRTQVYNWLLEQEKKETEKSDYLTWKSTILNSDLKFKEEFSKYFTENEKTRPVSEYLEKIYHIEEQVVKNIEKESFYDYLLRQNKDDVIKQLENTSSKEFVERIYFDLKYY